MGNQGKPRCLSQSFPRTRTPLARIPALVCSNVFCSGCVSHPIPVSLLPDSRVSKWSTRPCTSPNASLHASHSHTRPRSDRRPRFPDSRPFPPLWGTASDIRTRWAQWEGRQRALSPDCPCVPRYWRAYHLSRRLLASQAPGKGSTGGGCCLALSG